MDVNKNNEQYIDVQNPVIISQPGSIGVDPCYFLICGLCYCISLCFKRND